MDEATIQLLDSVDQLLRLRQALGAQLAEGWMEMTRARYATGASTRISDSLLNLRPHAALLLARGGGDDSRFELDVRSKNEIAEQFQGTSPSDGDSENEDDDDGRSSTSSAAALGFALQTRVDPLACFGGLVSPHLRSSQRCFQKALGTLMEVANAERTTLDACRSLEQQQ